MNIAYCGGDGIFYSVLLISGSYHGSLVGRGVIVGIKDGGLGGRRDILFFNDGGYGVNNKFYHLYLVDEMAEVFVGDYYIGGSGEVCKCYGGDYVKNLIVCRKIVASTDSYLVGDGGVVGLRAEFVNSFIEHYNSGILLEVVGSGVL